MIAKTPIPYFISAATDDVDPFVCPIGTLQKLLDNAPTEFEMGYLTEIKQFWTQLTILTGRE